MDLNRLGLLRGLRLPGMRTEPQGESEPLARQIYDLALKAARSARPCPHHRNPHEHAAPTGRQATAIISTVTAAIDDGAMPAALLSTLRRAATADPCAPLYGQMRTALAAAFPHIGFCCPACQSTVTGSNARVGYCGRCRAFTGTDQEDNR